MSYFQYLKIAVLLVVLIGTTFAAIPVLRYRRGLPGVNLKDPSFSTSFGSYQHRPYRPSKSERPKFWIEEKKIGKHLVSHLFFCSGYGGYYVGNYSPAYYAASSYGAGNYGGVSYGGSPYGVGSYGGSTKGGGSYGK